MKTVDISDEAFIIISSRAAAHAKGDLVAYVDMLVGVKERRSYEGLPDDVEIEFLKKHHPERLNNAEVACVILELIRSKAPNRFETVIGFRFPDRDKIVLSRDAAELGKEDLVRRIGESDSFLFVGFEYKLLREMLHEILITIGYSITMTKTLTRYITKDGDAHLLAFKYV